MSVDITDRLRNTLLHTLGEQYPDLRIETNHEGLVQIDMPPKARHQVIIATIARWMSTAAEDVTGAQVLIGLGVNAGGALRIPDLVWLRAPVDPDAEYQDGSIVFLAVEVMSPSTSVIDRGEKMDDYARAGIAYYWVVDQDADATIRRYRLNADGVYQEQGEALPWAKFAELGRIHGVTL